MTLVEWKTEAYYYLAKPPSIVRTDCYSIFLATLQIHGNEFSNIGLMHDHLRDNWTVLNKCTGTGPIQKGLLHPDSFPDLQDLSISFMIAFHDS